MTAFCYTDFCHLQRPEKVLLMRKAARCDWISAPGADREQDAHTWVSHMNTDAGVHMRTPMHASDAAMLKSFRGHADKRRVKQSSSVDGEQSQSRPPSRGGRSYWCTSVTAGELSNGDETQSARTDTFGRKLKGEFEIKIKVTAGKPISAVFLAHLLVSFALIYHHFPSTVTPNHDSLFICHKWPQA